MERLLDPRRGARNPRIPEPAEARRSIRLCVIPFVLAAALGAIAATSRVTSASPHDGSGVAAHRRMAVSMPHAHLLTSEPAAGDTLREPLDRVRLLFSEPVEPAFSEVVLEPEAGEPLRLGPRRDPGDARQLLAPLPDLPDGAYRLRWRIVSTDGHPASGAFRFFMARGAPASPDSAVTSPGPDVPRASGDSSVPAASGASESPLRQAPSPPAAGEATEVMAGPPVIAAAVRGLALGALLSLAGLLAMAGGIAPGAGAASRRAAGVFAIAAPPLLIADFLLWLAHASPTGLEGGALSVALRTQTGIVSAMRLGLAFVALGTLRATRRAGPAAGIALLAVVSTAALGHPAAIHPALAVPAKAIHLVALAFWLGGLLRLALPDEDEARFRRDAGRVSSLALAAVVAIALTGALQAALFLPAPAALVTSAYGLLVLGKALGLTILVLFGAHHRRRLLPDLRTGGGSGPLRRSVRREALVMAAVILLAALLAYVPPPPGAAAAAGRRGPSTPEVADGRP